MKYFYLIFSCLIFIYSGCSKEEEASGSPTTPGGDTTHYVIKPQHDIPWATLAQTSWSKPLHDAQCTGRSPFKGPAVGRVKLEVPLDENTTDAVIGSDSVFYIASDSNFYAITLNGTILWKVFIDLNLPNNNSPIVNAGGVIYIGVHDGLSAFSYDGTLLWHTKLDGQVLLKSNAIDLKGNIYTITNSGTLYSIDPSGQILWQRRAPLGSFAWGDAETISFAPDGSRFYVGGSTADQSLYTFNTNGDIIFIDSLGGSQQGAISIDVDGNVYSYFGNDLFSISSSGKVRWKIANAGANWNVTIDPNGNIAFLSYGNLISLDNAGQKRWSVPINHGDYMTHLVCDAEGTIFIETSAFAGSSSYDVQAVSNSGKILWTLNLGSYVKEAGPSLTREGYLLFPHSNYYPGTKHMYIIE